MQRHSIIINMSVAHDNLYSTWPGLPKRLETPGVYEISVGQHGVVVTNDCAANTKDERRAVIGRKKTGVIADKP